MTNANVNAMDEQEQRELAQRLADSSEVFGFDTALEIVKRRPAEAEELLRMREETARIQEERDRLRERRRRAFIEDFG
jgi:hypothetical protein